MESRVHLFHQGKRRGCGFCCTWMTAVNGVLEPPHLLYLIITASFIAGLLLIFTFVLCTLTEGLSEKDASAQRESECCSLLKGC
eukprot:scaffold39340_cov21-Tisochrysis_lutea.AAC.1